MCGIHTSISRRAFQAPSDGLKHLLSNRGPDHIGEEHAEVSAEGKCYWLSFTSTVLALRGGQVTKQPFRDAPSGSLLCWNGEAWRIDSESVVGNDGEVVFNLLLKASSTRFSSEDSVVAVLKVLRSISGPFAFTFLDKNHDLLYFGRDRLGRRSLLSNVDNLPFSIEISSCADSATDGWIEVEADGVYQLSFRGASTVLEKDQDRDMSLKSVVPCQRHAWETHNPKTFETSLGIFNRTLPSGNNILNTKSTAVHRLRHLLCNSLNPRILNVPIPPGENQEQKVRVAILFSGGLDCTVLARMAHDILPPEQEIDLINVAFENPRSINAAKKVAASKKPKKGPPLGLENLKVKEEEEEDAPTISYYEICPDRETGRKAFQELQNVCPERVWRFVAVDVPYKETVSYRTKVVSLIHPHKTEMDLSIAYALYFAARGVGVASTSIEDTPMAYSTPARVLLSGLGADELFGGYIRHETAFNRNGFSALLDELQLDVSRLGKRNLGRDDRVISHWGREARFPYLDESLVRWAIECPIWEKCGFQTDVSADPELPDIEPGKKVLRLLAYELGMHQVAVEKKRAIQFGARTAKMEVGIGRMKGTALIS